MHLIDWLLLKWFGINPYFVHAGVMWLFGILWVMHSSYGNDGYFYILTPK